MPYFIIQYYAITYHTGENQAYPIPSLHYARNDRSHALAYLTIPYHIIPYHTGYTLQNCTIPHR